VYFIMSLVVHNFKECISTYNVCQRKTGCTLENLIMRAHFHKHPFCQVGYGSSVSLFTLVHHDGGRDDCSSALY
jgi:hypothetical protein